MTVRILVGDCRARLHELAVSSVHAVVTDPPYELEFMGKRWDATGVAFNVAMWREVLRVLKPGGHLLAFGGTRTHHRVWCAIEDAGFEVRDTLGWIYGSGFPKSHSGEWGGTALKPAWEPIILARKPLIGTVEANWREHGTGAMNVDACRIPTGGEALREGAGTTFDTIHKGEGRPPRGRANEASAERRYSDSGGTDFAMTPGPRGSDPAGRWPANIIHDGSEEVLAVFPQTESGKQSENGHIRNSDKTRHTFGTFAGQRCEGDVLYGDAGSAARFFYCAKPSRAEREMGLQGWSRKAKNWSSGTQNPGSFQSPNTDRTSTNHHPTVKPVNLMRYLCRLVTPRGGLVLDPFMGSGTTGIAALRESFEFIGIEKELEYAQIARARLSADLPLLTPVELIP